MSLSNISIKTLNIFDKAIELHKKKVIEDIHNCYLKDEYNLDMMLGELLKKYKSPKKKLIKRPRNAINCCDAKIWISNSKEYRRCKFNKCNDSNYCGLHQKKQNYGDI